MATANSTKLRLSFHKGSGNYCKTVKGKRFYLGKDYDEALETWCKYRADFEVGDAVEVLAEDGAWSTGRGAGAGHHACAPKPSEVGA